MTVDIYTDGGARGNPGPAGIGIQVKLNGSPIIEHSQYIGPTTNNIAEYKALLIALELVSFEESIEKLTCYSDSQLMVKQILGEYKIKTPHLIPLHAKILKLLNQHTDNWQIHHIPREKNAAADALVNNILDKQT